MGTNIFFKEVIITHKHNNNIKKINKKLSDFSIEHNIGVAAYVINEVKRLDLETGGKIQIAIVDRDGYKELSSEEQVKHYQVMTTNLYDLLKENFSNKDKATKIFECLFPYE